MDWCRGGWTVVGEGWTGVGEGWTFIWDVGPSYGACQVGAWCCDGKGQNSYRGGGSNHYYPTAALLAA